MASQILHWQKMVFAESADSGFINRSFVGEFAPAGRFSIHIGVWYLVLPTSLTTFYYPGIWVCTCGLFGGACDLYHIVLGGPAGTMCRCTNLQIHLHHDQNGRDRTLQLHSTMFHISDTYSYES